MKLYKYQIKRNDATFSVGDEIRPEDKNAERVKILNIVKIDTDEMKIVEECAKNTPKFE